MTLALRGAAQAGHASRVDTAEVLAREPGFLVVLLDLVIEGIVVGHGHSCAGQQGAGEEDAQHKGRKHAGQGARDSCSVDDTQKFCQRDRIHNAIFWSSLGDSLPVMTRRG